MRPAARKYSNQDNQWTNAYVLNTRYPLHRPWTWHAPNEKRHLKQVTIIVTSSPAIHRNNDDLSLIDCPEPQNLFFSRLFRLLQIEIRIFPTFLTFGSAIIWIHYPPYIVVLVDFKTFWLIWLLSISIRSPIFDFFSNAIIAQQWSCLLLICPFSSPVDYLSSSYISIYIYCYVYIYNYNNWY